LAVICRLHQIHKIILENYDRTFLREYGTFLDDGKSAERALKKIKEITGKQNA